MLRRRFLQGLVAAPAVILTPGLLMAVKPVVHWGTRTLIYKPYIPLVIWIKETRYTRTDAGHWEREGT